MFDFWISMLGEDVLLVKHFCEPNVEQRGACHVATRAIQSLDQLGDLVATKRGSDGLRATAAKIGISPATLSRVEQGHLPDLENFGKICRWLKIDPSALLGLQARPARPMAAVHFRKDRTMKLETAKALADMILAAQRAMLARQELG